MKTFKRILLALAALVGVVFLNGCYYVFHGQKASAEKVRAGEDLNMYEIASIYTMHLTICAVGWVFSPEATVEVIGMSFRKNRDKVFKKETDFFLKYPIIRDHYKNQYTRKKIAFNGDISYSLLDGDHRLALAVNPGYLWRDKDYVYLETPVHYPICYNTHIGISKHCRVTINECLFSYLEKRGILHPYTIIYYTRI